MKKALMGIALALALVMSLAACQTAPETPEETSPEAPSETVTEEVPQETTEQQTTTEEETTEEPTTEEAQTQAPVSIEAVKAAAITFITPAEIKAFAENPQQDWSDFGGVTDNEDGSVKVLFTTGKDDKWDPYCYLVKDYVAAGNIAVVQYRCEYNFSVNLYIGCEGNVATGPAEYVPAQIYATPEGEWGYMIVDLAEDAMCYDAAEGVLGFLRFGLDNAEAGDTVDFGFVAFFYSVEEAAEVLPLSY